MILLGRHLTCGWSGYVHVTRSAEEPAFVWAVCGGCDAIGHAHLLPRHARQVADAGAPTLADEAENWLLAVTQ